MSLKTEVQDAIYTAHEYIWGAQIARKGWPAYVGKVESDRLDLRGVHLLDTAELLCGLLQTIKPTDHRLAGVGDFLSNFIMSKFSG